MNIDSLIVYETEWVIKRIYEVSDSIRDRVTDQTKFEERCIKRVGEYLNKNPERKKHRRFIERMIKEVASAVIKRNKNEHAELFSTLSSEEEDKDGQAIEYEPEDVLADVESEVIVKEMTALLAQDGRRKIVIEAWTLGNTNSNSISRTLARTIGGGVETHRKFIQRFEKECRTQLGTAI